MARIIASLLSSDRGMVGVDRPMRSLDVLARRRTSCAGRGLRGGMRREPPRLLGDGEDERAAAIAVWARLAADDDLIRWATEIKRRAERLAPHEQIRDR